METQSFETAQLFLSWALRRLQYERAIALHQFNVVYVQGVFEKPPEKFETDAGPPKQSFILDSVFQPMPDLLKPKKWLLFEK